MRLWIALLVLVAGLALPGAAHAAFPGANGRVFYEYVGGDDVPRIGSMNEDGSDDRFVAEQGLSPAASPDGRRIAFVRGADVWVADADGTRATLVATNADDPAWSPDGRRIAFVRGAGNARDLWAMDADGSAQALVSGNPASESDPAWSPDGTRIAFTLHEDDVWTIRPDGTGAAPLIAGPNSEREPDWSPDGAQLVFTLSSPTFDRREEGLYVVDADGSDRRPLGITGDEPVWSPDGRWIAFDTVNAGISKIRPDGTGRAQLGTSPAPGDPSWAPVPGTTPVPLPPGSFAPPPTEAAPVDQVPTATPCSGRTRFRAALRATRRTLARRFRSLRSGRALHVRLRACEAGEMRIIARGTRSRRVLARGRAVFLARGSATLRLVPTPLGRRYARRPGRPALRVTGRFVAVP